VTKHFDNQCSCQPLHGAITQTSLPEEHIWHIATYLTVMREQKIALTWLFHLSMRSGQKLATTVPHVTDICCCGRKIIVCGVHCYARLCCTVSALSDCTMINFCADCQYHTKKPVPHLFISQIFLLLCINIKI